VAAAEAGVSKSAGVRWFREAGGMDPCGDVPGERRLSIQDREAIARGLVAGWSCRRIAAGIGRSPSTVTREVRANMRHRRSRRIGHRGRLAGLDWVSDWDYSPHRAQLRAEHAARRPKATKLAQHPRLRAQVQAKMDHKLSPEQIAHRLEVDFPDDKEMRISHETIYRSLFVQGRGELRRDLHQQLRTGRATRRPRRRIGERGARITGMLNISERPAEAEDRAVPGHWEGDLIMGSTASNSAIGTLVERTTRYVILLHLPHGHGADAVEAAMAEAIAKMPQTLRKTLTWDQGTEMANHAKITAAHDLAIYFCDPHSPWQRGSNENTNGLLRQYFPKGTDLSGYHPDYLEFVADQLNSRPRKTLGWATPAEKLDQLLSNPPDQPDVAATG
jgi:IS30 family transposase